MGKLEITYVGSEKTKFFQIDVGEVFFKDVIWMKITKLAHVNGSSYNVIDLETGKPSYFESDDLVETATATLAVEVDRG